MTDETTDGELHIDSDWKEEAAREKERLAAQERQEQASGGAPPAQATFAELLNLLAMQAAVSLGGLKGPDGEAVPPNPIAAKYYIDLMEVLEKKTEGNLTEEEKQLLESVLYELRMQYVRTVGGGASSSGSGPETS